MTVRARSIDDPALREDWNALLERARDGTTFFQTWEWHAAWWRVYGGGRRRVPLLLAVERDEALVALAPLYVDRRMLGTVCLWEHVLWMAYDVSPYPDLVAERGDVAPAWDAILAHLAATRPRAWLELRGIYAWSSLREARLRIAPRTRPDTPALLLPLPRGGRVDDLVRPDFRRTLRRIAARQQNDSALSWHVATGRQPALERELQRLNTLRFGGASFFSDPSGACFFQALCDVAGERFFFSVLRHRDATAHIIFCFLYGNVLYYFLAGMDPRFADLEPGMINFSRTLAYALETGIERFDFLRGEERYKRDFGGEPVSGDTWTLVPSTAARRYGIAERFRTLKRGRRPDTP